MLVTIADEVGAPDGMTVVAAGDLWVVVSGGGQVRRDVREDVLRQALTVPTQATSCAFAGPG